MLALSYTPPIRSWVKTGTSSSIKAGFGLAEVRANRDVSPMSKTGHGDYTFARG